MELKMIPLTHERLEDLLKVEENAFSKPWSRQQFLGELASDATRYFLAEADGQIVGYAGAWLIVDEVQITNIAVHSDYRRRGIGKALLTHLLNATQKEGATFYSLEVRRSNLPAQALYKSQGFSVQGERKNYYGDEDALIMLKEL
ncbi:MAG: ribosomal protein S18-alanine N-acetyltransferase [Clostridia bacterium]|nr:ribosomal protein S18-alanine N-acetyltransferase [Clostridia bacterium]